MENINKMHKKKLENLLNLTHVERYNYFIREVVQFEKVWVVANNKGYFIVEDEGDVTFLVWPHKELAQECIYEEHVNMGGKVESILLDVFLDKCIPDMMEDEISFAVFFNENREGLMVAGQKLREDIEDEYEEIWG